MPMAVMNKRVLVTGATGYIGSVFTGLALKSDYKIRAIDALWFDRGVPSLYAHNPDYKFLKRDICEIDSWEDYLRDIDFVVHFAAVVGDPASKKFPELTRKINYEATINLIEKCRKAGIKGFIFMSTCSNYGVADGMADEESQLKPLSLYAETKVGIERSLMDDIKGLDWVICRLSTVYGESPRMRFDLTVNDFTKAAFKERYLKVFLPHTHRPYIHVADVGKAILSIIGKFNAVKNNVFNIGFNTENYKKIQIVSIVKKHLPMVKVDIVETGSDLRDYQVDFTKFNQAIGAKEYLRVEDGVLEIIRLLESGLISDTEDKAYYNNSPSI